MVGKFEMQAVIRALTIIPFALFLIFGGTTIAWAGPIVWGLHPVSGDIVQVDPRTGAVLGAFAAPIKLVQGDTRAGLSIADGGKTLLYQLGNNGPGTEVPGREILYGLDPFTGVVKFQVQGLGSSFGPDGISWQSQGGSTFTFFNHANPIADIHRIENIGTPGEQEMIYWGPTGWPDYNHSVGGLGGDGNGREFGVFLDINNLFGGHRFIGEYDPISNYPVFLNTFIAPADDLGGLAFDGRFLYALSASGSLYTLNPNTGAVTNSVQFPQLFFPDGSPAPYQFDIAAVPEPSTISLLSIGVIGLGMGLARRRSRHIGPTEIRSLAA